MAIAGLVACEHVVGGTIVDGIMVVCYVCFEVCCQDGGTVFIVRRICPSFALLGCFINVCSMVWAAMSHICFHSYLHHNFHSGTLSSHSSHSSHFSQD